MLKLYGLKIIVESYQLKIPANYSRMDRRLVKKNATELCSATSISFPLDWLRLIWVFSQITRNDLQKNVCLRKVFVERISVKSVTEILVHSLKI